MMFSWIVKIDRLVTTKKHGDWCRIPYEGHKKGCPMYGTRDICPPKAPFIKDFIDVSEPMYFVHSNFNFIAHTIRMKIKHPKWSKKQCGCVLYWQSTSRKEMRERVKYALRRVEADTVVEVPEAMGVNVYATGAINGFYLDRIRNLKICKHVSLLGVKK